MFWKTFEVLLWDLKGTVSSPFKVTTRRTSRSEIVATRSYIADNLKVWVGSQSHKLPVCVQQIQDIRVRGVGVACGCVSMFYKR